MVRTGSLILKCTSLTPVSVSDGSDRRVRACVYNDGRLVPLSDGSDGIFRFQMYND